MTNKLVGLLDICHGVTYYYFAYHCFIEYVRLFNVDVCKWSLPYCLLKRDGATRWTMCDKL